MTFTEMVFNSYVATVIVKTTGIKTIFNYTKQAQQRPGLDVKEAWQFLSGSENKSIYGAIKCFVIKKLGSKCK